MFKNWQQEKATTALIDAAQDLADRLQAAKPHVVENHAAAAQFWAVTSIADGHDLRTIADWTPAAIKRFTTATQTRIAALRKQRAYDSSDGLAIWLHTARAVSEPRIAPAAHRIWALLQAAGANSDVMADDLLTDAGLPAGTPRIAPAGFGGTADLA